MDENREKFINEVRAFIYDLKKKGYSDIEIFEAVFVKYSGLFKDESI